MPKNNFLHIDFDAERGVRMRLEPISVSDLVIP